MTGTGHDVAPEHPEPTVTPERRTSFLELFFDLVFVFAITEVTGLFGGDLTRGGFARGALILFLIWWAWAGYAWLTNAVDVESPGVRIGYLVAMFGSFFMALAVPHAFDDQGAWFAIPFLFVRVLHVVLYAFGLRGDRSHQAAVLQLAPWFLAAPVVVVVGGFVDDPARTWLWVAAVVIDLVGVMSVGRAGFRVTPSHFAERYGLFVIIALGEAIIGVGLGAAELERDATFAIAVGIAFAGAAALWWAYFDIPARAMERNLHATPEDRRGPFARDVFSIFHYPIILGIILGALGAELTVEHPLEPLPEGGRWALGLGLAFYLLAFVLGRYRAVRAIAWERAAGAVAAVLAVWVLDGVDALVLLAVIVGILVVTVAFESTRLRAVRAGLRQA